jgi:hypothetical protein
MAMKSFREMQRETMRRISNVDFSTTDVNALLPKVKGWLNGRYREILRFRPWTETLFSQNLSIVADTTDYVLDRKTDKIWNSFDTTHGYVINRIDVNDHVRNNAISFDSGSSPLTDIAKEYYSIGTKTVAGVVGGTTGEKVSVVSTSASDVSPLVVYIKGEVGGVEISESLAITGVTAHQSANTYDAGQHLSISIGTNDGSEPSIVGVVTASGVTSTTVFTKLTKHEPIATYEWIREAPTPNASATWRLWASRKASELVDDNDIPILSCSDEMIYGAYADALREDGQEQEANIADQKFVSAVTALWVSRQDTKRFIQMMPSGRDRYIYGDFGRSIYVS